MENINISVEEDVKKKATEVFNKFGLTITMAIDMFLNKAISEDKIPFEVNIPNEETRQAIEEGRRIARDENIKSYTSIKELREALEV